MRRFWAAAALLALLLAGSLANAWYARALTEDMGARLDRAQELAEQVKTLYPDTEIYIAPIGPIIGSHTGPGMLALIFWGTER